jgi:hypothetical protein
LTLKKLAIKTFPDILYKRYPNKYALWIVTGERGAGVEEGSAMWGGDKAGDPGWHQKRRSKSIGAQTVK